MKRNEFLKCIREYFGYSQETLSQKMHLSRAAISQHETGNNEPTMEDLQLLSEIYDLPLNIFTATYAESLPPELEELLLRRPIEDKNFSLFLQTAGIKCRYYEMLSDKEEANKYTSQRELYLQYFSHLTDSEIAELYELDQLIRKFDILKKLDK